MTKMKPYGPWVLLALLLLPAGVVGQEQTPERGSVEFGVRHFWGDVYGRPDLPFSPALGTSKFNEYRDLRNNFFIRRLNIQLDDVLGSKNYLTLQSQRAIYKDQSYLVTFGQYGRFKFQVRYDEIPHTYTNTARTIFTQSSPGVYTVPLALRTTLQTQSTTGTNAAIAAALPGYLINNVLCGIAIPPATQPPACSETFITPSIVRRAVTTLGSYNLTPDWTLNFSFWREHESGTRPIGQILNSSPSASATAGVGVELPEPIDYFNNTVKVGTEYGRKDWGVQVGYTGSFFENNIGQLVYDNPFRVSAETGSNPLRGRADLYPNNHAHYLNLAGAFGLSKHLRLMASVNPGWLGQNDKFVPYTTNGAINTCGTGTQPCSSLSVLPVSSLGGEKQTLAMNYTLVTLPWKNVQVKATYRHYDYNNNTPIRDFTPIEGDVFSGTTTPDEEDTAPHTTSFNRKYLELSGNWMFAKRSSLKVGYGGEWLDRTHRDAEHSVEHSVFGALDLSPHKDLLFRLALRHQDRKPDVYQDEAASDPATGDEIECTSTSTVFTEEQRCHRRFDEAARLLDRADVTLQYDVKNLSLTGGFQTIQSNYNRRGGSNSPTPLNFQTAASATLGPYYLYGALKDFSYIYTFDATYSFSSMVSMFVEYTHEKYHRTMVSRNRSPITAPTTILTCTGCDTANNDWASMQHEVVDTYGVGTDFYFSKKIYLTTYYTLAAGKSQITSAALGDPGIKTGANAFTLTAGSAAQDYPEATTRTHEVAAVFKYNLSKHIMPKLEYRFQQYDNKDFQTSVMMPYMGCIGTTAAPVTGCPSGTANLSLLQPSSFYPYSVVGDTSAARYIFLGADQPSYRSHIFSASIQYTF